MTIGVAPAAMVAAVPFVLLRMPSEFNFLKKSMPGCTLSAEPPLARATAQTALNAALACVGSPLRATLPLYIGLSSALNVVGQTLTLAESHPIETYPP